MYTQKISPRRPAVASVILSSRSQPCIHTTASAPAADTDDTLGLTGWRTGGDAALWSWLKRFRLLHHLFSKAKKINRVLRCELIGYWYRGWVELHPVIKLPQKMPKAPMKTGSNTYVCLAAEVAYNMAQFIMMSTNLTSTH